MSKRRIDLLMVERGLVESRALAQRLVMAGEVRVDNEMVLKPSTAVSETSIIEIMQKPLYVSRGGNKLAAALMAFPIQPEGLVCADVGSSTGGFTDCLLQHGARLVYAIDVGKGILHWKLRTDPRVIVIENTNARYLDQLPEVIKLATVDVSFISLRIILPVIRGWFSAGEIESAQSGSRPGDVIALIKPQYEVGRIHASRGDGVIRDPDLHRNVLWDILSFSQNHGYSVRGLIQSPILGPKGNTEFLAWLEVKPYSEHPPDHQFLEKTLLELFM